MITLDDYYPTNFYNESLEALKNNNVGYQEFINIKDYKWYIDLPNNPVMVNYDELPRSDSRWLVTKIKPLRPNEEYLFQRRLDDTGKKAMLKYVENKPMKEARLSDYAVFFNARNKEQLQKITKEFPGTIYYFGNYYSNKYKLCLCSNKMILNYIDKGQILLESTSKEIGMFEAELNFKVFRGNDYLAKYTETPYFKDGNFKDVKIRDGRIHKL